MHKYSVSVHVVVGLKLFATIVSVNDVAIVWTILVLVSISKDVLTLSPTLQGQTFLSFAL